MNNLSLVENRLQNMQKVYSTLEQFIDELPSIIPEKTKQSIKDSILGDDQLKELMADAEKQRTPRLFLFGRTGCGKSSIIKLICGEDINYSGTFEKGSGLKISYVPQDIGGISGNLSDYARQYNIDESLFKAILRKLDFARIQFEKDISSFSDGQKKKVLIAKSLCEKAHLHIWDEPMNYIDVISRMQIEKLITDFEPTIVFVEHDKAFCDNIATKIIEL